jgi:hypothetical protein
MVPTVWLTTVTITSLRPRGAFTVCLGSPIVDACGRVGDKGSDSARTHVQVSVATNEVIRKRLRLRPWTGDDGDAAAQIFGRREGEVAR